MAGLSSPFFFWSGLIRREILARELLFWARLGPHECYCFQIIDPTKAAVTLDGENIDVAGMGFFSIHDGKAFDVFGHEVPWEKLKDKDFTILDPDQPGPTVI